MVGDRESARERVSERDRERAREREIKSARERGIECSSRGCASKCQ